MEASNFAPGTTAADIESALQTETVDENGVSGMLSCRLVKSSPTVVAEMVFSEKAIAEQVISIYHNQKADGRILRLEMKRSGPGSSVAPQQPPRAALNLSSNVAAPEIEQAPPGGDDVMEDVEIEMEVPATYDNGQGREPKSTASNNTTAAGYGFEDSQVPVSDAQHDRTRDDDRRDRDRDYDRDRERERERERDRDRERDRERDRDGRVRYERRDERPNGPGSYHRDGRSDSYNSRPSHYGNGVGGPMPGRGMFGGGPGMFGHRGGRMYSDDMMRGGPRGRGSFGAGGYGRGRY